MGGADLQETVEAGEVELVEGEAALGLVLHLGEELQHQHQLRLQHGCYLEVLRHLHHGAAPLLAPRPRPARLHLRHHPPPLLDPVGAGVGAGAGIGAGGGPTCRPSGTGWPGGP